MPENPKIRTDASSTGGTIAGLAAGIFIAVFLAMALIKIGMIWFG